MWQSVPADVWRDGDIERGHRSSTDESWSRRYNSIYEFIDECVERRATEVDLYSAGVVLTLKSVARWQDTEHTACKQRKVNTTILNSICSEHHRVSGV